MGLEGLSARFFQERLERIDRSDDPRRQAVEQVGSTWVEQMVKSDRSNGGSNDATTLRSLQVGEVVTVRKHSSMGCAVVSMTDVRVRQAAAWVWPSWPSWVQTVTPGNRDRRQRMHNQWPEGPNQAAPQQGLNS